MFGFIGHRDQQRRTSYLNSKKCRNLFVLSGATNGGPQKFSVDHARHGGLPVRSVVYAKHILLTKPDARIAILSQNDDFRPRLCRPASSARWAKRPRP